MRLTILASVFLTTIAACNPGDATTDNTTTLSTSTSLDPSDVTTSGTPTTTGDLDTSGGSTTTTTGEQVGGPCDGVPNDDECMCAAADAAFCSALDAFCRDVVHLDLSGSNPPGTDYCDTIASWCASPGVSTYSACELLESTCEQVAPSGNVKDCKGLRDTCACDGFMDNGGGDSTTTGGVEDTTGGEESSGSCDSELPACLRDRQRLPVPEHDVQS